jgi:hypothetical protein
MSKHASINSGSLPKNLSESYKSNSLEVPVPL